MVAANYRTNGNYKPLGDPPKYFDDARREIWDEIKDVCPIDLKRPDFFMVEQLAKLIHISRTEKVSGPVQSHMRALLIELEMAPSARKTPKSADKPKKPDEKPENKKTTFTRFKTPSRPK